MELCDFHCHLEELDRLGVLADQLKEARHAGVTGWLSSALCPEEYIWHREHKIEGMKWCAGIHPYYEKSSIDDFEMLVELCENKEIYGIGEIGLDSRNPDHAKQEEILLKQLDLAQQYELPVIFHVVKKYYELFKIIKNNFPKISGWLHGFSGSIEIMEAFSEYDIGFSINARMPQDKVIRKIIERGVFQIETDAPYAKPYGYNGNINQLSNLSWVSEQIKNIMEK